MKIKIIQFNILNGFCTEKHNNENPVIFQPERLKLSQEIIKKENPDILVLCEANFAFPSKDNLYNNYKKIFNYPFCLIGSSGKTNQTVILSKYKMKFHDYSQHQRIFLRSILNFHDKEITLDVIHPHPQLTEVEKEKFVKSIIRDKKEPYIIAGDFNSLSPEDKYSRDNLINGFSRFDKNAKDTINELMKFLTIKYLLNNNLQDTFIIRNKKWNYTIPTDYLSKFKDSGIRIDYIFCSKDIKVIDSGIIKNKLSENASDHYPIFAILDI